MNCELWFKNVRGFCIFQLNKCHKILINIDTQDEDNKASDAVLDSLKQALELLALTIWSFVSPSGAAVGWSRIKEISALLSETVSQLNGFSPPPLHIYHLVLCFQAEPSSSPWGRQRNLKRWRVASPTTTGHFFMILCGSVASVVK